MNVKYKLIGVTILLGIIIFVNANIDTNKKCKNVSLAELINTTEANAECAFISFRDGRCSRVTGNCYWDWPDYQECDYTLSMRGGF